MQKSQWLNENRRCVISKEVILSFFTKNEKYILALSFLGLFIIYLLVNLQFTGPTYPSDEVAYLTKASAVVGHKIDYASSWHAGYSFIIAPLFIFFSNTASVWAGVMVINAALLTASLYILYVFLRSLFPKKNKGLVFGSVLICSIYPGIFIISGYAFASIAFLFLFMLSLLCYTKIDFSRLVTIVPFAILAGLLYLVHPTGIAVGLAGIIILFLQGSYFTKKQRYPFIGLYILIIAAIYLLNDQLINTWLASVMTPDGYKPILHYPHVSIIFQHILSVDLFARMTTLAIGQVSYIVVATLGLAVFATAFYTKLIKKLLKNNKLKNIEYSALVVFISIIGFILMSVVNFYLVSLTSKNGIDQIIFGRYNEMILLPLLAIGVLAKWQKNYFKYTSIGLFLTGIILFFLTSIFFELNPGLNYISDISFWPQYIIKEINFIYWFTLASVFVGIGAFLKKSYYLWLIAVVYIFCIFFQTGWHAENQKGFLTNPSGLDKFVTQSIQAKSCIGIINQENVIKEPHIGQRLKLHMFYLYKYDIQRASSASWKSNNCPVYLTNDVKLFLGDEKYAIGREEQSGLYAVFKKKFLKNNEKKYDKKTNDFYIVRDVNNQECLYLGCFDRSAEELKELTLSGVLKDGSIATTEQPGVLIFGPYASLKKGTYGITIDGTFDDLVGSNIEIISGINQQVIDVTHLNSPLSKLARTKNQLRGSFKLDKDVDNLQIRVSVGGQTNIKIRYYNVFVN